MNECDSRYDFLAKCGCRDLLKHHVAVPTDIDADPTTLVSAATAHCVSLSSPEEPVPATTLSLQEYQLDPSFL